MDKTNPRDNLKDRTKVSFKDKGRSRVIIVVTETVTVIAATPTAALQALV